MAGGGCDELGGEAAEGGGMSTTKAEELAARLESGWCPIESPADMERAAAELRRLAAVEAERDDLKLAFAHTVRLVQDWKQSAYAMEAERDAMRLDYSRLLEKHNNLHANAARDRAERDALLDALNDAAQSLTTIAENAGRSLNTDGTENYLFHFDQVRGYARSRAGVAIDAARATGEHHE